MTKRERIMQSTKENWFQLVQTAGIIMTLSLAIAVIHANTAARKVDILMEITRSHREIWGQFFSDPKLFRVVKPDADIEKQPITDEERLAVLLLVLHLNAAYQATEHGVTIPIEGMQRDVTSLFSLPIPKAVWEELRHFQNDDFQAFVEEHFSDTTHIWK